MDKFQLDSIRVLEIDRIVALPVLRIFLRPTIEHLDVPRNKKLTVKSVHIRVRFRLEGNVVQSHLSAMESCILVALQVGHDNLGFAIAPSSKILLIQDPLVAHPAEKILVESLRPFEV